MKISSGPAAVIAFWTIVFIADKFLKRVKRYSRRYRFLLENLGLSVSVCQIRWYTTSLNRVFLRAGSLWPRALRLWFSCGVVFGGIAMIFSIMVLIFTIYRALKEENPEQILKPVMPGVNLPWRHILYYFVALSLAGMVHEVGHAVAAAREQVRVNGCGLFIMALYPGAYVDLHPDHLAVISHLRQLRVFCAGVWHNFVIVVMAFILWTLLPYILLPLYSSNKGAVVANVLKSCPLKSTLLPGDIVTSINECPIMSVEDWKRCIKILATGPVTGYCGNLLSLARKDTKTVNVSWVNGEPDCCFDNSSSRFCFTFVTFKGQMGHSCLPARSTLNNPGCVSPKDCPGLRTRVCLKPLTSNKTKLLKIAHSNGLPLLFVGNPWELFYSIALTPYLPKASFLSVHWPEYIETFLLYLISLSGALALLNVVPCYALDGQWALHGFIEYFLENKVPNKNIRLVLYYTFLFLGSLILLINVVIALWSLGKT